MVTRITGLTKNGLTDFVLQRFSAYVMLAYGVFLFFLLASSPSHAQLKETFSTPIVQWSSLLVVLLLSAHAWIGLWTIGTDYIRERAFGRFDVWLRSIYQLGSAALIVFYVIWSIQILWSS